MYQFDMKRNQDFFVGIDSDGCVFDTMEIKHKECFIPNIILYWDLQPISKYARETAEFVNLYSRWRGINRFPALVMVLDLLSRREECIRRGYQPRDIDDLRTWIREETRLGNPALEKRVRRKDSTVLKNTLAWSRAVNKTVEKTVRNVPPFPFVRESLERLREQCDIAVISATPHEALQREWTEHGMVQYADIIAGQEMGTKKESMIAGAGLGYRPDRRLMIGDAPGDHQAAMAAGALFYPINPGREEESWEKFFTTAYDRFISGTYQGEYEQGLILEFQSILPNQPWWKEKQK